MSTITKVNELESTLLSKIASLENVVVRKLAVDISKVSDLMSSENTKINQLITSMKIESVETKGELLTKIGVESNRFTSFSSKTDT